MKLLNEGLLILDKLYSLFKINIIRVIRNQYILSLGFNDILRFYKPTFPSVGFFYNFSCSTLTI